VEALPATGVALLYATSMHDGQTRRSDGAPFILLAADKAARVHELRVTSAATPRPPAPRRRRAHDRSSLRLLEERLPDAALTARLRDELARLGKRRRARTATR